MEITPAKREEAYGLFNAYAEANEPHPIQKLADALGLPMDGAMSLRVGWLSGMAKTPELQAFYSGVIKAETGEKLSVTEEHNVYRWIVLSLVKKSRKRIRSIFLSVGDESKNANAASEHQDLFERSGNMRKLRYIDPLTKAGIMGQDNSYRCKVYFLTDFGKYVLRALFPQFNESPGTETKQELRI